MYTLNDICAVIVFYNGENEIINNVKELKSVISNVLIIDNNSDKENADILISLSQINGVEIINNKKNKGIAYALNQGLDYAEKIGKRLLLTLDQDSSISGDTIIRMLQKIDVRKKIVSVGPFYGMEKIEGTESKYVTFLITSGNLVDVKSAKSIGGYNSDLFIDCVDIDFSFNLVSHGFKLMKVGQTFMKHKIGEYERSRLFSIPYLSHSPKRYYFKFRNNIIIYRKYVNSLFKLCLKLFCSLTVEFLKIVFVEQNKFQKLYYAKRGVEDGFKFNFDKKFK